MKTNRQAGFSVVEGLLVVLVLVAIGAVGYFAMNRSKDPAPAAVSTNTNASTDSNEPTAPEVKSTSDLTEAEKAVDSSELDASDAELDAELDKF